MLIVMTIVQRRLVCCAVSGVRYRAVQNSGVVNLDKSAKGTLITNELKSPSVIGFYLNILYKLLDPCRVMQPGHVQQRHWYSWMQQIFRLGKWNAFLQTCQFIAFVVRELHRKRWRKRWRKYHLQFISVSIRNNVCIHTYVDNLTMNKEVCMYSKTIGI